MAVAAAGKSSGGQTWPGWRRLATSQEAFIRRMVDAGYATDDETTHHNGVLVWKTGQAIRHPDGLQRAPRMLFHLAPEPKTVKNRMHLDVRIGDDDRGEVVAKLIARDATKLWDGRQGPHTWVTMADPEGNEFCVA